jgi:hypothetical protein
MQLVHVAARSNRADEAIRAAHESNGPVMVTWGAYCQLGQELGGPRSAQTGLRELASNTGHPIAYSAPSCDSDSETHVFTPASWGEERTLGWLGGFHQEVEAQFGSTDLLHERPDGSRTRLG